MVSGDKEQERREELSRCLDALACGRAAVSADADVQALADTAAYIKKIFLPPPAPLEAAALAEAVATRLAAERRHRRRGWLFSGVAGAAAAIVVALALHLQPGVPGGAETGQSPAVTGGEWAKQQQQLLAEPGRDGETPPAGITVPPPAGTGEQATTPATPAVSPPLYAVAPAGQTIPPVEDAAPAATGNVKASASAGHTTTSNGGASQTVAFLTLPGRSAETVYIDRASGMVRQVYNLGAAGPVIITQRPRQAGATGREAALAMRPSAVPEGANKITVTVGDWEVTVEGKLPPPDLQKIAVALVPQHVQP